MTNVSIQETEVSTSQDADMRKAERRQRWQWAEASIWTDAMLTALENGIKGGKWFSLIDKVFSTRTLNAAWEKVEANRGAAGIDGQSVEKFGAQSIKYIKELSAKIQSEEYEPMPVKRVYIPKGEGKFRPLGIPTVKDRIAQQAVKLVMEPIFEREFLSMNYGFRPGKGQKDALRHVDSLIREGNTWVVDADMKSFFDTIPHDILMQRIERRISDGRLLRLISKWLKHKILEESREWMADQGTPQGGVLSPLLANIYLHDLDVLMTSHGYQMVRFADDFVVLTRTQEEAQQALVLLRTWVNEHGLSLHPEKTHLGNCLIEGQGFDFLGYRFEGGKRWIRRKSTQKFRDRIRELTPRTIGNSLNSVIVRLNPILRGWYEYFKHVSKWGLGTFDSFVRRRLRSLLRKQEKHPGFGRTPKDHQRWPNSFFEAQGLFTMENHRRSEIACRSR